MADVVDLASVRHPAEGAVVVPDAFTLMVGCDEDAYGLLRAVVAAWMKQRGVGAAQLTVSLQRVPEALPGLPIR